MKHDDIQNRLQQHLIEQAGRLYASGRLNSDLVDEARFPDLEFVCADIRSKFDVEERREWSHYGQGYASFRESWFYKPALAFEAVKYDDESHAYRGISVLFSRLESIFLLYESEKRWNEHNDSATLPSPDGPDHYSHADIQSLASHIAALLAEHRLTLADKNTLSVPLDPAIHINTNLSSGERTLFDAYFHWFD